MLSDYAMLSDNMLSYIFSYNTGLPDNIILSDNRFLCYPMNLRVTWLFVHLPNNIMPFYDILNMSPNNLKYVIWQSENIVLSDNIYSIL
jgi:hypothetical protein